MKILTITNEQELEAALVDGCLVFDGHIHMTKDFFVPGDIRSGGDILSVGHIRSGGCIRSDGDIRSGGDILSVGDIRSGGCIRSNCGISSNGYIYTSSIYGVQYRGTLRCRAVVPGSGPNDRALWAARFGIDTSTGCCGEFVSRLSEVAEELLKDDNKWLPIERLMLESSLGMYWGEAQ